MLILTKEQAKAIQEAELVIKDNRECYSRIKDGMEIVKKNLFTEDTKETRKVEDMIYIVANVIKYIGGVDCFYLSYIDTEEPQLNTPRNLVFKNDEERREYLIRTVETSSYDLTYALGEMSGALDFGMCHATKKIMKKTTDSLIKVFREVKIIKKEE